MDRMRNRFAQFMVGRYGVDDLSRFLLGLTVAVMVCNLFVRIPALNTLVVALLVYIYFRMFSKNIQARYAENGTFLKLKRKLTGGVQGKVRYISQLRTHHIYHCPSCNQKIRVPRGKGKIIVTCPKCRTEFEKKS